jgi:hypothetical protein
MVPPLSLLLLFPTVDVHTLKGELPNAWADYFASLATPTSQEDESTFNQGTILQPAGGLFS